MKILISNVYCHLNHGDAGIVEATINGLRAQHPSAEIVVVSLYSDLDQGKYGQGIRVIQAPVRPLNRGQMSTGLKLLSVVAKAGEVAFKSLLYAFGYFRGSSALFRDADLVVSCGGGYMQSKSVKQLLTEYLVHWVQLYCAKAANTPYVIFAQTIGPFDMISRLLSRPVFNGAFRVLAREPISFDCVKRLYPDAACRQTGDVAFLLKPTPYDWCPDTHSDGNIGITVRSWHFPGASDRDGLMKRYVEAIKDYITTLSREGDYGFYLMPQCVGPEGDNDLVLSRLIVEDLKGRANVTLIDFDIYPSQLKSLYSKMDFFVGTRMHSVIFSLAENVPCLAISYDKKTDGIMEQAGLSEYVLHIDTVTGADLLKRFHELKSNPKIREIIRVNIESVKRSALTNFIEIESVLRGKND